MTINNSLGITLNASTNVTGTIYFNAGNLITGVNTLTVSGALAYTSGGIDASNASGTLVFATSGIITLPNAVIAANINNLTINSGVTLNTLAALNVNKVFSNSGSVTGSGTVNLSASGASVTGIGTLINLTASNNASVTSGNQSITGTLIVTSGTLNAGTNGLTLKSTSIANTAVVGNVCTGCKITGTATVERYIPAGYRAYRDMVPQVYNSSFTTGSVYKNWQENGSMTSGTGFFITGTTATHANTGGFYTSQPAPDVNGLDYSINGNNSAYAYVNGSAYSSASGGYIGFNPITNTTTTNLDAFSGYRVLIRGDRSFNLATTPIINYYNLGLRMVNATTLRSAGNLVYGTVTYSTSGVTGTINGALSATLSANWLNGTASSFSMIANPYACPVYWGDGTVFSNTNTNTVFGNSSGINGSYWFLDPTMSATGFYRAYNALTGGSTYPNYPSGISSGNSSGTAGYQYIQ